MKIKAPVRLSLDGDAVLKEAVARLAHAKPAMAGTACQVPAPADSGFGQNRAWVQSRTQASKDRHKIEAFACRATQATATQWVAVAKQGCARQRAWPWLRRRAGQRM